MRINPKNKLFDLPILTVRKAIRLILMGPLHFENKKEIVPHFSEKLNLPITVSKKLLDGLLREGYLECIHDNFNNRKYWVITETPKGRQLGVTRANPPITRDKADMLLSELLNRVREVNLTTDYVYFVQEVKIFGSYLTEQEILGDLDVLIQLERRFTGADFIEMNQRRINIAMENGRQFQNYVKEIYWPQEEVLRHLSTSKKGLSIHVVGNDEIADHVVSKSVFKFNE